MAIEKNIQVSTTPSEGVWSGYRNRLRSGLTLSEDGSDRRSLDRLMGTGSREMTEDRQTKRVSDILELGREGEKDGRENKCTRERKILDGSEGTVGG